MKFCISFLILISLFLMGCTDEDLGPNGNVVSSDASLFIVQGNDESLARIDLNSGAIEAQAVALGNIPNDIVAHGDKLYVTNSGFNTVQEINATTLTTIREIAVTQGINVWSVAILNDDSIAVSCFVTGNVVVIRLSDEAEVANLPAGVGTEGLLTIDDKLFVMSSGVNWPDYGAGSVLVFDRNTLERIDSLSVGINPQNAAVDPANRLHVVCTGNYNDVMGEVHVIDLISFETIDVIEVGGTPVNVCFSNDFAFVSAGGWVGNGKVYRYDLFPLEIVNGDTNPILTSTGATDIESDGGSGFFVSCYDSDVVEYRNSGGTLIAAYPVSDGPGQMAIRLVQ